MLGLGIVLQAAGANTSSGFVLLVACGALGALGVASRTTWRARRQVRVRRDLPTGPVAGRPTDVVWTIEGLGRAEAVLADATVGATARISGDGAVVATVRPRRGHLGAGSVTLFVTDALGLVSGWVERPCDHAVTVVPAGRARGRDRDRGMGEGVDGQAVTRSGGDPIGLREHRSGDGLARVHWRATARHGHPMTRLESEPTGTDLVVALEGGDWPQAVLDLACDVVTRLASGASAMGRVVLLDVDGRTVRWGDATPRLLACLPPAAGVPARPLAPPVRADAAGAERLVVAPTAAGIAVTGPDGVTVVPLADAPTGGSVPGAPIDDPRPGTVR